MRQVSFYLLGVWYTFLISSSCFTLRTVIIFPSPCSIQLRQSINLISDWMNGKANGPFNTEFIHQITLHFTFVVWNECEFDWIHSPFGQSALISLNEFNPFVDWMKLTEIHRSFPAPSLPFRSFFTHGALFGCFQFL